MKKENLLRRRLDERRAVAFASQEVPLVTQKEEEEDPVKEKDRLLIARENAIRLFLSDHKVLKRRKLKTIAIKFSRVIVCQGSARNAWAVVRPWSTRFYNKALMREMAKDDGIREAFPEWERWDT